MNIHPNPQVQARRWLVLPVLCISLFMVVVDNLIINVALPTLSRELGASTSGLQWIVDAIGRVHTAKFCTLGKLKSINPQAFGKLFHVVQLLFIEFESNGGPYNLTGTG
jgi:hypothetical protein